MSLGFFFFNDTATTEIYTLSLHDALPIYLNRLLETKTILIDPLLGVLRNSGELVYPLVVVGKVSTDQVRRVDRKSTRLNSSHANISYAVFCLKKKTIQLLSPVGDMTIYYV